jgi:g-D-glutamyl-meso-diaminopimelate peptidase
MTIPSSCESVTDFIALLSPEETPAPVEEPFDPMSLVQSEFYIYSPINKVDLFTVPKESKAYKQIGNRIQMTYAGDMGNGYHKVLEKTGRVFYITDYDFQNNMEALGISPFAVTESEEIPRNAEAFTVKYDGDRVLRLTKSIYLEDNVAGIVEKGQTVYKLKDYGQIFYVALEDGTAGYMNSQCLETTKIPEEPYDIVSADDSTYAYDEMMEDIELLAQRYKNNLIVVEIGKSTLGNDIPVLLMGNEGAQYKILVQASIHAREYPSTPVLMKQLEVMLYHINEPNSSGKTYEEMLEKVAYYIMPMTNPDGVLLSQMGEISIADERMRQKVLEIRADNVEDTDSYEFKHYFEQWKSNIDGVDLNRNFDANWDMVHDNVGKPSSDGYKGSAIFSETETQFIKKYVDMEDVKVTVSYHTSGNLLFWWYFQEGDYKYVCLDLAKALGDKSGYEIMEKGQSRYSHGGVKDYGIMQGKPGITYEIGRYSSPIPPLSVYYAAKRTRVLPELGYWLIREIRAEAEWLEQNMFPDEDG